MFCTKCGAQNPEDARFCYRCGHELPVVEPGGAAPVVAVAAVAPRYAGFWRRFVAIIIDNLILMIPNWILQVLIGVSTFPYFDLEEEMVDLEGLAAFMGAVFWASVLSLVLDWLYHALFESSNLQATPGKMALGIIVTDTAGSRISFGRATGRHFAKIISALPLCIGFMMAGWTRKKQALHDIITDCLVVCKK